MSARHPEPHPARQLAPATVPPPGLHGLDPAWSRVVTATGTDGTELGWHVLDSGTPATVGTIVCVHGNPTWSYLWRRLVAEPPPGWRVVAPDQIGMGFSARVDAPRTLAQRVDDLGTLTDALGVTGPDVDGVVVTVAHDWGGPISLGWALAHRAQVRGVVLANTAVHQPADSAAPSLIRLARTAALRDTVCVRTPTFVRATTALSRPALPRAVRDAFAAPYGDAASRQAVGDFVADIPLEPSHVSAAALDAIRDGLPGLADVPALMLWGPRDPVFGDRYLRDLLTRLPHADVHRFEGASHLVTEDAPQAFDAIRAWVAATPPALEDAHSEGDLAGHLEAERGGDLVLDALRGRPTDAVAVVELGADRPRRTSFGTLATRVEHLTAGLAASGVRPGDRVALLVPPGRDLLLALYAAWRAGAVVVLADAGLGVGSLGRALRGAGPTHVIGIPRGLLAARALRVPGRRVLVGSGGGAALRALGAVATLDDLVELGRTRPLPPPPADDDDCAVLFTSGATGPPKGVVYRNRQVRAQVEAIRSTYGITPADRIVAAFAPFAIYGPLLGIASAVPDVDVTKPGELTAAALADAVGAVDATVVFASPAALRNVVRTADGLDGPGRAALARVRLVLSAGAPVPAELLRAVGRLLPSAALHTPYGMTEALPVTTVSLDEIEAAGPGNGVCVGRPVAGVRVALSRLDDDGQATGAPDELVGVTGEICVQGEHVKDRYDRLWVTERASSRDDGWHRTGDVGHVDADGRLWVEGRLAHVVITAGGVVTPVGVERRVEQVDGVALAAVVGVGPSGTQQVVVVVETDPASSEPTGSGPEPDERLAAAVRAAANVHVTAVLVTAALPVDIRHESKIDRRRVAAWAARVLAGERTGATP